MHCTIYQVSSYKDTESFTVKTIQDKYPWFLNQVADYVHPFIGPIDKMIDDYWGDRKGISYDAKSKHCIIDDRKEFFKRNYEEFTKIAKELSAWDIDAFIDKESYFKMMNLRWEYDDRYGTYILDTEGEEIMSVSEFMRYHSEGFNFYVISAMDYHY